MLLALIGALSLASVLWLAPAAVGAPPANDHFADREVLSGTLPIEVTRSNLEATKESEEFLGSLFAAGHSVWFEWEATSDGWVTIGGCDADFTDVVGVYAGTAINSLTRVAGDDPSEGPHCPFRQREYTFKAVGGTHYLIAVDGNPFSLPEAPPADTEGTFELRIEATPPPVNDSFASATSLVAKFEEEDEGHLFYFGSKFGYNWNASKESGEPEHGGDPGGASVWYSWTAPESGTARIGGCCGGPELLGVYTGGSVDALTPASPDVGLFPGDSAFAVSAGTTYRIAVDGEFDAGAGEAETGSFSLRVSMDVPARPSGQTDEIAMPLPEDGIPPKTTIVRKTLKPAQRRATFAFRSSEPGSSFRCKLDGRAFVPCKSPKTYKGLKAGKHTFKVAATDAAGNVDLTPATAHFPVPARRHGKR